MELLVVVPFYFLLLGGGALVALAVMAPTTLRQPPLGKTLLRWLLVLALGAAQVSCWRAADGFAQNVGGGGDSTGTLQWTLIGVVALWLAHQVWRLVSVGRLLRAPGVARHAAAPAQTLGDHQRPVAPPPPEDPPPLAAPDERS